jgi:CubicO group peptidase (beta-lactamase class C family)
MAAAGGAAFGQPKSPEGGLPPVRDTADTGPAVAEGRFDGADAYIAAAMRRWEVPGLAIAAVKDGEVVLARGYGVCEVGGDRRVVEGTVFDIASCAKAFTSASLALMVDQGKVHWDDPVVQHLPECRFPDPYMTRHATLRDLLCHRTGLQRGDLLTGRGDMGRGELVRRIRFLEAEAPFRTKDSYSNLMYVALGEVVARVAGRPWEEVVTDDLLRPLGMHTTSTSLAEGRRRTHAPRHWRAAGKITSRGSRRHMPPTPRPVASTPASRTWRSG